MKRISPERKTSILAKRLPPYNMPVCHRHKSCLRWLTKVIDLPVNQRLPDIRSAR